MHKFKQSQVKIAGDGLEQVGFIKEMRQLHLQYTSQLRASTKLNEIDAHFFSYELIRDLILLYFLAEHHHIRLIRNGIPESLTTSELFDLIMKHDLLEQALTTMHDKNIGNIEISVTDALTLVFPRSFSVVSSSVSDQTTELLVRSYTTSLLNDFLGLASQYCWNLSEYGMKDSNCLTPVLLSELFEALNFNDIMTSGYAQKESGSYYTPIPLAAFMSRRLLSRYFDINRSIHYPSILDPATGTGQLLLTIAQELFTIYTQGHSSLDLSPTSPSVIKTEIINHLYGIDINQDALIICYYRLWLWWLAEDDQTMELPMCNIRYGDALAFDSKGDFLIATEFVDIFSGSFPGFDLIIGNPPYVDHKLLTDRRRDHQQRFETYSPTADLSQYFVELGRTLLNDLGILCYITTNQFLRTNYGRTLRGFLNQQCILHELISFGNQEMFVGLTISTMIMILSRNENNIIDNKVRVIDLGSSTLQDITTSESSIQERTSLIDQNQLTEEPWHLTSASVTDIFIQIKDKGTMLQEVAGIQIQRGVTTGRNSVFLVDTAQKEILHDASDLIKPCIQGRDIKKNRIIWNDTWLLLILQGTDLTIYPSLQLYLEDHRDILQPKPIDFAEGKHWKGRKPGSYQWYELQDSTAFHQLFEQPKIVWGLTSHRWSFAFDDEGYYLPSNGYILVSDQISLLYLTALLNSSLMEFYFSMIGTMTAGGAYTMKHSTISKLPVIVPTSENSERIEKIITVQRQIVRIVNEQGTKNTELPNLYEEIDRFCFDLYCLDTTQREFIRSHLENFHTTFNKLT